MEYNINFCIISAAYLLITAFFYRRQARVPSRRNMLFNGMLTCGLLSVLLDILAAVADRQAALWPVFLLYAVNIVFLASVQVSGVLLFYYTLSLTGTYRRMKPLVRLLVVLPLFFVFILLLVSPFSSNGAFYLDENHIYHHGGLHLLLYVVMGLYLFTSFVIVFHNRQKLRKTKFFTVLAFLVATLIAMFIQMNHPYLLVNTTANAFALMLMYHILEAPSAHVDALTGAFNRAALMPVLRDMLEEGERCSLLTYTLNTLPMVNHSFGMRGGDEALAAFAAYLKETFPKQYVFRIEGDIFGVLLSGGSYIDIDRLEEIRAATREKFEVSGTEVTVGTTLASVNSEDCASAEEMLSLLESVMRLHHAGEERMLVADETFKKDLLRREAIRQATQRALDEDRVQVYYQPIHDGSGKLCAMEALVRIEDPEMGFLPAQELVELAEGNGMIIRLGEQVLRKTCAFIRDNRVADWGIDHIGVNLSAIQCVRDGLPGEVAAILSEYGIEPGLIAFEVTETAAGALANVKENMEQLIKLGIQFLLDDFGTGYANFKNMAALPFRCIKIDKSLLWSVQNTDSQLQLLSGVVKVIHALRLTSLCEGVETEEQLALLRSMKVSMLQGYYYAPPLSGEKMIAYAERTVKR